MSTLKSLFFTMALIKWMLLWEKSSGIKLFC